MSKYRHHVMLIVVALIWLALFDFFTQISSQGIIYPDSHSYQLASENLYVFFRGDNYRPILISAVYGIPYLFGFGNSAIYTFSFYINIFCWIASFLIFYEIAKTFLKLEKAFWLTLASMSFVGLTAYVFHFLSETLYLPVILLGLWFLAMYYRNRKFFYLSMALALFICSMLIRPGAKFFAIILLLFFLPEILKNFNRKAIIPLYAGLFLVFVQCAGLKFQTGNFTVSYIDGVTLYNYIGSRAMELNGNPPRDFSYIYSFDCPTQKQMAADDFINQVKTNFPNLVRAYFWDLSGNTTTGNVCIDDCKNIKVRGLFLKTVFYELSRWQNIVFTCIGIILSLYFFLQKRQERAFLAMAFFIVYTISLSAISHSQGDCFHMVTYPFALLLIAKVVSKKKLDS